MKKQTRLWITLILFILVLTACQSKEEQPAGETIYLPQSSSGDITESEQSGAIDQEDDAYPIQTEVVSEYEVAYPVSPEDLKLLDRSWYLYAYREDGADMEPANKSLTFSGNRYALTTDEGTITGSWTARIESPDPILVLDSGNSGTLFYEIILLDETTLNIRTVQDQIQIEEDYMPVD
ncbi:MAG: hypothetical protein RQ728_07720 [Brevefilum sp.]|nr:hypothetical protein [Brevefilum sp.]MDT8382124.1 hypothetical protein [Brevefilum sp.]MDW7755267.1 hypothetical protein [Brevefilum sp.]